jgi:parafibromin
MVRTNPVYFDLVLMREFLVKGMYVAWSNDPQNPKVKDWNVTELKIDPHRRHVDKSVVAHFWKAIDSWTLANKPWLTG